MARMLLALVLALALIKAPGVLSQTLPTAPYNIYTAVWNSTTQDAWNATQKWNNKVSTPCADQTVILSTSSAVLESTTTVVKDMFIINGGGFLLRGNSMIVFKSDGVCPRATNVAASATSSTAIRVTWDPLDSALVTGVTVYARSTSNANSPSVPFTGSVSSSFLVLSSLTPATQYEIFVLTSSGERKVPNSPSASILASTPAGTTRTTATTRSTTRQATVPGGGTLPTTTPPLFTPTDSEDGDADGSSSSSSSSSPIPIIAGAAGGGVVLIVLIVLLVIFVRRKRNTRTKRSPGQELTYFSNPSLQINTSSKLGAAVAGGAPDEVSRSRIKYVKELGKGNFGVVYLADVAPPQNKSKEVDIQSRYAAVKMLHDPSLRREFEDEVNAMRKLKGKPHVVNILGVVLTSSPELLLLEVMENGNLLNLLRSVGKGERSLSKYDMTRFAWEVCNGMRDIAACRLVHRDLAARNVLVGSNNICKISDFGLARNITRDDNYVYHQATKRNLPLKWMAPESLEDKVYTTQTDVWSFGIVLWEIFTLGQPPYSGIKPEVRYSPELLAFAKAGKRLPKPSDCPDSVYNIMLACWSLEPSSRPSFDSLERSLEAILQKEHSDGNYDEVHPKSESMYDFVDADKEDEEGLRPVDLTQVNRLGYMTIRKSEQGGYLAPSTARPGAYGGVYSTVEVSDPHLYESASGAVKAEAPYAMGTKERTYEFPSWDEDEAGANKAVANTMSVKEAMEFLQAQNRGPGSYIVFSDSKKGATRTILYLKSSPGEYGNIPVREEVSGRLSCNGVPSAKDMSDLIQHLKRSGAPLTVMVSPNVDDAFA